MKKGITSHTVHIGGAKVAPELQISHLKIKFIYKIPPKLEIHLSLDRLPIRPSLSGPRRVSKITK